MRVLLGLTCLALIAGVAPGLLARGDGFETPPVLSARDRVPADVLTGAHHRIDDRVENDGFMNHFVVHSDFGEFEAPSERMLATRVREVYAIAKLRELSQTDAFSSALKKAATAPVDAVEKIVDEPVETLKGIPGGVTRKVRGLYYSGRKTAHKVDTEIDQRKEKKDPQENASAESGGAEDDEPSHTDQAKAAAKSYVGYTSAYRELAKSLQVDPYTSNPVLKAELTRLSRAAFAAGLGFKMVVPVPRAIGVIGDVSGMVWDTPPEELERRNNLALKDLGIDKDTRLRFFANPFVSLTTSTLMVEQLKKLAPLPGRAAVIELAASVEDEQEMWFLTEAVQMLASYHTLEAPLAKLVLAGNDQLGRVLAGVTAADRAVVPVPFDHVTWQPGMEQEGPLDRLAGRELWLTGTISERAQSELDRRGFAVHTRSRAHFQELATPSASTPSSHSSGDQP